MTTVEPRAFPFGDADRLEVDPLFARLRREEPLCRIRLPYGEPAWLATRYEDVRVVLGDPRFSRAAAAGRDEPRARAHRPRPGGILSFDPPEHTRLRRLVAKAFTVRRVEQLRPRAQEIADGLADAMLAKGAPADLVEDFGLPLPITVICELLGVPVDDRTEFRTWSDAFLSTTRYTPEQVADHVGRLREYMAGLIARRRRVPSDDLLGALVAARDEQERLSEEEMLSLAEALLVAGHETTASQIPNFVYVLLTYPEQLAALRADPGLIPVAVEELMRFVPLGGGVLNARYALEDVELGGVTVRAGEPVVAHLASANRDESVYTRPGDLDLHRQEASHVGFGHGPHHCLGAPLARMELQVALGTLLRRLPGLRLAGSPADVAWKTGLSTRGPEHMAVTWDDPS
ncbi:cytochrome P450 [Microbispora sp. ATCC PTA-5024]|uniref:cytochrome P450 n=1 Tax=Microbispora sp. ATCC PTA-5024 TaxID=316330 RepID=UPI0003DD788A|nr:cytochrome P450 [Microbispora sp. ATCC PTA-5024]ETK30502.1 cytochrome P450 [Microbispora sp. ATCC PTA-5024]